MRGAKGARVNVLAVQPFGGTGYTTAKLSVVRYQDKNPKTAKEAMEMWFALKNMEQSTVRSDLTRRLPASGTHVEKLVRDCGARHKTNILLRPYDVSGAAGEFLDELELALLASPEFLFHCAWSLPSVTGVQGGVYEIETVAKRQRVVNTGELDTDCAWGMVQAFLRDHLPLTGLRPWYRREEYMERRNNYAKRQGKHGGKTKAERQAEADAKWRVS